MSQRGMKKWNAYKSLPEHDPAIRKTMSDRYRVLSKPLMSNEEAEIINNILVNYKGQEVHIEYYRDEEIYKIDTTLRKIDKYRKLIITKDDEEILFSELTKLHLLEEEFYF